MELMTEEKKGFERTEFGLLPTDWTFEEIGPKIDLLTGNPFSSSGYSDHGVRLLRGANIKRGNTQWDDDNTRFWPEYEPPLKKYELKPDDLVIAMDGSLVGRSYAFLSERDVPSYLLQRVARIRSEKIDTKYLKYFIGSSWFIEYCDSVKTNTAIPHISSADIKNFKIPLPPTLEEQQAIASALSDVDDLIRSIDGLIQKKQAIKKGTMQQLISGKKRLPGFDGEWIKIPLKERVDQFLVPMRNKPKKLNGPIPWCRIEDFSGKYLYKSKSERGVTAETVNEMNLKIYPVNTLLVSCSADLGRCAIVKNRLVSNQTFIGLVCKHSVMSVEFLYYYMIFNADTLNELSSGTTISYLSRADFEKFEIEIPSKFEEQKAIAKILSDMDRELQTLRQKREKYQQVKQGMMQELLTGKVRLV